MPTTTNKIISLVFSVNRLMREKMQDKKPTPYSFLQLLTLSYVRENKNPLMKDVANYLCITPSSATSLIDSLAHQKILERQIDTNDRRIVRIAITPKGEKSLKRGLAEVIKQMEKILSGLNKKEQKNLIIILEKIIKKSKSNKIQR